MLSVRFLLTRKVARQTSTTISFSLGDCDHRLKEVHIAQILGTVVGYEAKSTIQKLN